MLHHRFGLAVYEEEDLTTHLKTTQLSITNAVRNPVDYIKHFLKLRHNPSSREIIAKCYASYSEIFHRKMSNMPDAKMLIIHDFKIVTGKLMMDDAHLQVANKGNRREIQSFYETCSLIITNTSQLNLPFDRFHSC